MTPEAPQPKGQTGGMDALYLLIDCYSLDRTLEIHGAANTKQKQEKAYRPSLTTITNKISNLAKFPTPNPKSQLEFQQNL